MKIGRNCFKYFALWLCLLSVTEIRGGTDVFSEQLFFKKMEESSLESFFIKEIEFAKILKTELKRLEKECSKEVESVTEEGVDQGTCFKTVKDLKIRFYTIVNEKRKNALIKNLQTAAQKIQNTHRDRVKLILNSSPEDVRFYELW